MPEPTDNAIPQAPRTKKEKYGTTNQCTPYEPSEFKDVPAGPGLERRENGKVAFAPGNEYGKLGGYPYRQKVAQFKSALMEAITEEDIKAIALKMIERAKAGDMEAAKEVLNRTIGKVSDKVEIEGSDGSGWSFTLRIRDAEPPSEIIDLEPTTEPLDPLPPPTHDQNA